MLEFLGQMGRILIDMGANPAVGEMFETLKQAEPSIRKIAMALLGAAPALAELTVEILRIVAAFVDTEQIEAFLGTLTSIASVVADVVEQAWFQKLLSQIGPLLGTFLALQTALNTAKFAFNVIIGSLIGLLSIVGSVIGAVATFKKLWKLIAASNPVGWIILIVAAFVDFVAGSEQMQNYIGTIIQYFQQWGRAAGQVMNFLKPLIQVIDLLFTIIGGLAAIVFQIGTAFVMVFGKMILRAWNQFYGTFEPALTQIIGGLEVAIEAVKWFFDMLIGGISTAIGWVEAFFGVADANDAVATSADSAATNLGTTADAIDNTGTAASNNTGAVNGFADGVNAIKSSAVDAITSNLDFMDSMDSLSSSIEGNKSKLLDNTAAGRENQRAILDAAQAVQDKMQADIDAGLPLDEVNARYKENYEALKQTAIEAGLAESEVEAFVKAILEAPALTELELRLNTDNAQRRLNDFIRNNGGTPAFIGGAGATLRAFGGFDDHVKGVSFASGGISEGVYRSMARPLIKFAEPETGWEAFVSGRKGSEERNRGIVREAASRLGMNMGGVSITVNPSPGMDERALAGAVSQEITKLMRKGSMY
jgi:deoxyribose-phosphate aldolase